MAQQVLTQVEKKSLRKSADKGATKPKVKAATVLVGENLAAPATAAKKKSGQKAAKPEVKAAPAPEAATAQEKAKPATAKKAAVQFVGRRMQKGKPVFVLDEQSRPVSGIRLFAHTHAALTIMGLLDASRPVVPKSTMLAIMGQRAVTYHTQQQNLESAPNNGIRLSIRGYNKFKERAVDANLATAFQSMFLDGEVAKEIGVKKDHAYPVVLG